MNRALLFFALLVISVTAYGQLFTPTTPGLVPAPGSSSGDCLKDDATWSSCGGAASSIDGSTTLPGTCAVKDVYVDTDATPAGQQVYLCTATNTWTLIGDGTGASDHGALTGLSDDDHTQYHNDARGDARYLQQSNNLSDLGNAATARTNLGVDPAGTDNSTDVTLAGTPDYITIAGQVITRALIDLANDVTGLLPYANLVLTNAILEADLKAVDSPSDEECLTYEATGGDFEWQACGVGSLSNIVEDTTPQLGGQLDVNGNSIGDGTNELITFIEDASAVNEVQIENAATGSGPIIRSTGDDVNVELNFDTKGTADVNILDNLDVTGNIVVSGTTDGRDVAADGSKLDGIEASADVTDEANVKAALDGATITAATVAGTDKVLVQDADDADNLKTVTAQSIADLGAGTTDHGALTGLADDDHTQYHNDARGDARYLQQSNNLSDLGNAATARTNLGVDPAGTDNSTDVTLAGALDYITIAGQVITRAAVDLATDITGKLVNANLADMAQDTIKGRVSTGTGTPEDLTATQVRSIIDPATLTVCASGCDYPDPKQAVEAANAAGGYWEIQVMPGTYYVDPFTANDEITVRGVGERDEIILHVSIGYALTGDFITSNGASWDNLSITTNPAGSASAPYATINSTALSQFNRLNVYALGGLGQTASAITSSGGVALIENSYFLTSAADADVRILRATGTGILSVRTSRINPGPAFRVVSIEGTSTTNNLYFTRIDSGATTDLFVDTSATLSINNTPYVTKTVNGTLTHIDLATDTVPGMVYGSVMPNTLTVCAAGCDYTDPKAAVEAANAATGEWAVFVEPGVYSVDPFTANAEITVVGLGSQDDTIIQVTAGSMSGDFITSAGATWRNITFSVTPATGASAAFAAVNSTATSYFYNCRFFGESGHGQISAGLHSSSGTAHVEASFFFMFGGDTDARNLRTSGSGAFSARLNRFSVGSGTPARHVSTEGTGTSQMYFTRFDAGVATDDLYIDTGTTLVLNNTPYTTKTVNGTLTHIDLFAQDAPGIVTGPTAAEQTGDELLTADNAFKDKDEIATWLALVEADVTLDNPTADAVHDNVAGEIAAITEKVSPVSADLVVIEDSEDSNNKKRVQVGNLPGTTDVTLAGTPDYITIAGQVITRALIDLANDVTGSLPYANLTLTNAILEADLKAVDAAADEECLTYEATGGDFEWQACGAGGGTNVQVDTGGNLTDADFQDGGDINFAEAAGVVTATVKDDTIDAANLADGDFGDFSVATNVATLDANTVDSGELVNGSVDPAHLADADFGDFTVATGVATLDANTVDSAEITSGAVDPAHLADADFGDFTVATGVGSLDADVITQAEIADDAIQEEHLKAVDAAADEECLTYEVTTGDFEWQTCGGGSSDFVSLTDTPSAYTGEGGKYVKVNSGETALEFVSAAPADTQTHYAWKKVTSETLASPGQFAQISVPSTAEKLRIDIIGTTERASGTTAILVELNGDAVDTNYHHQSSYGDNGSAVVSENSYESASLSSGTSSPANSVVSTSIILDNPQSTTQWKNVYSLNSGPTNTDSLVVGMRGMVWENTAAITTVDIADFAGDDWDAGSSIVVYEWKEITVAAAGSGATQTIYTGKLVHDETLTATSKFDVSSIPQTGKNLRIIARVRGSVAATSDVLRFWLNNDTTTANYFRDTLYQQNTTVAGVDANNTNFTVGIPASSSPASAFSTIEIFIPNYSDTTTNKTVSVIQRSANTASQGGQEVGSYRWLTTNAVDRFTLEVDGTPTDGFLADSSLQIIVEGNVTVGAGTEQTSQEIYTGTEIERVTVTGSPQTTITFSGVPAGYDYLEIRASVRNDAVSSSFGYVHMSLNSDTTDANYRSGRAGQSGGTFSGSVDDNRNTFVSLDGGNTTGQFSNGVMYLYGYDDTAKRTTFELLPSGSHGSSVFTGLRYGEWENTATVTSIAFTDNGGDDFDVGTEFILIGHKAQTFTAAVDADILTLDHGSMNLQNFTPDTALGGSTALAPIIQGIDNQLAFVSQSEQSFAATGTDMVNPAVNTWVTLDYDTEKFDNGGIFDTTGNSIEVKKSGRYYLFAQAQYDDLTASSDYCRLAFSDDGGTTRFFTGELTAKSSTGINNHVCKVEGLFDLAAGDSIIVQGYTNDSTTTADLDNTLESIFTGYLISSGGSQLAISDRTCETTIPGLTWTANISTQEICWWLEGKQLHFYGHIAPSGSPTPVVDLEFDLPGGHSLDTTGLPTSDQEAVVFGSTIFHDDDAPYQYPGLVAYHDSDSVSLTVFSNQSTVENLVTVTPSNLMTFVSGDLITFNGAVPIAGVAVNAEVLTDWTALTGASTSWDADGTLTIKAKDFGDERCYWFNFATDATAPSGNFTIDIPDTWDTAKFPSTSENRISLGQGFIRAGGGNYTASFYYGPDNNTINGLVHQASGTYATIATLSPTVPGTFGSAGDLISGKFCGPIN